jgi:hypothetical protein
MCSKQEESLCKPGFIQVFQSAKSLAYPEQYISRPHKAKTQARELLPEDDVWFWDGRMGREEGDDGLSVGNGDGREDVRVV